jgi:hypothetical protein
MKRNMKILRGQKEEVGGGQISDILMQDQERKARRKKERSESMQ